MSDIENAGWTVNLEEGESMDDKEVIFSLSYSIGIGGDFLWNYGRAIINITPITNAGRVLSPQLLEDYIENLLVNSSLVNTI